MATQSNIFTGIIPWTEEPGRLQSMGHKQSDTTEHIHVHMSHQERTIHYI